jgi:Holliday junction resolvasome RuvABC DNA-binding subunit
MIIAYKGYVTSINEDSLILNVNDTFYKLRMIEKDLTSLHQGDHVMIFTCKHQDVTYGFLTEKEKENFLAIVSMNSQLEPKIIFRLLNVNPSLKPNDIPAEINQEEVNRLNESKKKEMTEAVLSLGFSKEEVTVALKRMTENEKEIKVNKLFEHKTEDLVGILLKYLSH